MAVESSQKPDGQQYTSEEIEAILNDLEVRLDRLKISYEQYFMGIEKLEPQVQRKEVTRIFNNLNKMQIRNTGLRFRYRTIVQRWNLYITRWNRVLREIENGTYERDVLRAQRNMAKRGVEFPAEELGIKRKRRRDAAAETAAGEAGGAAEAPPEGETLTMEADLPDEFEATVGTPVPVPAAPAAPPPAAPAGSVPLARVAVVRPGAMTPAGGPAAVRPGAMTPMPPAVRPGAMTPVPPRPGAMTPAPPAGRPAAMTPVPPGGRPAARTPGGTPAPDARIAGGMTMAEVETLYRRLVHAKRLCGEPVDTLKLESLVATINKQAPKIMAEHRCRQVEFTVALKNDKPILKAIPKK
jgi:hypothetical protein